MFLRRMNVVVDDEKVCVRASLGEQMHQMRVVLVVTGGVEVSQLVAVEEHVQMRTFYR